MSVGILEMASEEFQVHIRMPLGGCIMDEINHV
jgi:hypothetical protein